MSNQEQTKIVKSLSCVYEECGYNFTTEDPHYYHEETDVSYCSEGCYEAEAEMDISVKKNIKNKGTGAGGSNTNKNGLPYEELTDLNNCFTTIEKDKYSSKIKFNDYEKILTRTKQSNLFKCMKKYIDENIKKAHGCKNPDECYIDENIKTIFIIEKKFQQVSGSVCEKIQTPDFKLWQYNRTFPEFNIVYIYCLSEWFKNNCEAEIEYLKYKKIPFYWGNSNTYKDDIINFIINYK